MLKKTKNSWADLDHFPMGLVLLNIILGESHLEWNICGKRDLNLENSSLFNYSPISLCSLKGRESKISKYPSSHSTLLEFYQRFKSCLLTLRAFLDMSRNKIFTFYLKNKQYAL